MNKNVARRIDVATSNLGLIENQTVNRKLFPGQDWTEDTNCNNQLDMKMQFYLELNLKKPTYFSKQKTWLN